jgi:hypothetical protein
MRFRTTILQSGRTATGIVVPPEVFEALGGGGRAKVAMTINGYTYRSSIATVSGRPMVGVSAETRAAAGVAGGDEVEVVIVLDTAPRIVEVPHDLAAALSREPAARARFDGLSYSHQRQHVLAIEDARTPETRQRRIDRTIASLLEGGSR